MIAGSPLRNTLKENEKIITKRMPTKKFNPGLVG
jgi:hypothetical protein